MTAPTNSVYSVTRKLDLASLLVLTAAYGFLFAFMHLLQFRPLAFAQVAGFFTCVGVSQAILFGGKAPRLASSLTGAIYFVLLVPFQVPVSPVKPWVDISLLIPFFIVGLVVGYYSGACIGGVFLVINYLRNRIHSQSRIENELQHEKVDEDGE